jgi:hypothetical protein
VFKNIVTIGSVGTAPHVREIKAYSTHTEERMFAVLFLSRAAVRTVGPISALDGSFDADFAQAVPFASGENLKTNFTDQVSP